MLIIDEEHRDQTEKRNGLSINSMQIRLSASAAPKSSPDYDNVQVNDEDVIAQVSLSNVELNPDGVDGDVVDNMVHFWICGW